MCLSQVETQEDKKKRKETAGELVHIQASTMCKLAERNGPRRSPDEDESPSNATAGNSKRLSTSSPAGYRSGLGSPTLMNYFERPFRQWPRLYRTLNGQTEHKFCLMRTPTLWVVSGNGSVGIGRCILDTVNGVLIERYIFARIAAGFVYLVVWNDCAS